MSKNLYLLTSGEYSSYRILALVTAKKDLTKEQYCAAMREARNEHDAEVKSVYAEMARIYGERNSSPRPWTDAMKSTWCDLMRHVIPEFDRMLHKLPVTVINYTELHDGQA